MASSVELLLLAYSVPLLREGGTGTWALDWSQTDLSTHTLGNSTSPANLTATWTVAAGDASAGSVYVIEVPVTGTWEANTLNAGFELNGSFSNVAPVGGGLATAGHAFVGRIRCTVTCLTAGSGGTVQVTVEALLSDSTVSRLPTNSVAACGNIASTAFNTTTSNTLTVAASFGATTGGQTVSGVTSTFTRKGP